MAIFNSYVSLPEGSETTSFSYDVAKDFPKFRWALDLCSTTPASWLRLGWINVDLELQNIQRLTLKTFDTVDGRNPAPVGNYW